MSIQVVCECGFRKEVPDDWLGMRVKCKCGRSFVISLEGSLEEPPVAEPPVQTAGSTASAPATAAVGATPSHSSDSVAARYRARHRPEPARRRWGLLAGAAVSLVCLGLLAFVLRGQLLPRPATTADTGKVVQAEKTLPTETATSAARHEEGRAVPAADARPDSEMPRVSDTSGPLTLGPDDGVLLTGLFGTIPARLELTAEQSAKCQAAAQQFTTKAESLRLGSLELSQWFVDCGQIGSELLGLLSETQQESLRGLLQDGQLPRLSLEAYAARLRPELETPSVPWRLEADGVPLEPVSTCTISLATQGPPLYAATANGLIALPRAGERRGMLEVWNLLENRPVGVCPVPESQPDGVALVSQSGRYIVCGGKDDEGNYEVQAWPVTDQPEPGSAARRQVLPVEIDVDACQLVSCAANRVLCVAPGRFWVWNLDTDETRAHEFSDWAPARRPTCVMSPGGRYVVLAHCHAPTIEGQSYHFLELAIHDVDSGELLGNRVVATDYLPFGVSAVAFSYNGRELALLWDVASPAPSRLLVQLSAINGSVLRIARDLPPADTSFALRKRLPQRELIWLPDNTGWVIGMRGLADTESEAVVDIQLPGISAADGSDADVIPAVIEMLPAGNHRLLLLIAAPGEDPSVRQVAGQFLALPELGPFM